MGPMLLKPFINYPTKVFIKKSTYLIMPEIEHDLGYKPTDDKTNY